MDSSQWGWKLFAGILGIIAGIIVLNHPLLSPILVGNAVIIILGIQGLILGVVGIIQAFQGGDVQTVAATTLITALIVMSVNLIVDLLYGVLDPRVRLGD